MRYETPALVTEPKKLSKRNREMAEKARRLVAQAASSEISTITTFSNVYLSPDAPGAHRVDEADIIKEALADHSGNIDAVERSLAAHMRFAAKVLTAIRADPGYETRRGVTGYCQVCDKALDDAATGRRRGYCSSACRQRAYRRREKGPQEP